MKFPGPTLCFWAFVLLLCARELVPVSRGVEITGLERLGLCYLAAWFVARDAHRNHAWPVDHMLPLAGLLFPVYVVATRKWKGVLLVLLLIIALALPGIVNLLVAH